MVATGKFDAYWAQEYILVHDVCAGAIIIKEAGGFVSHKNPEEFITPEIGFCFATNGHIHKELVELTLGSYNEKS